MGLLNMERCDADRPAAELRRTDGISGYDVTGIRSLQQEGAPILCVVAKVGRDRPWPLAHGPTAVVLPASESRLARAMMLDRG